MKLVKNIEGDSLDAFKVRLLSIGDDEYLMFILDERSKSDYIRLSYGYADSVNQRDRRMHLFRDLITEPKEENGLFLDRFNKNDFKNKNLWIVFETVQRQKGKKGMALEHFAAISPPQSKWLITVGSYTNFKLRKLNQKEYDDLNSTNEVEGVKKLA